MFTSLCIIAVGIAAWVAGAFYEKKVGTSGKAAVPGFGVTLVGIALLLWSLKWWIGLAVVMLIIWGVYKYVLPDSWRRK